MMTKEYGLFFGLVFIIIFSLSTVTFGQSVNDVILMTENYPPFNFSDNEKLQGISVDLMVAMLKKLNSKQSRDNITLLPWARGYNHLLNKKNTCLFATTKTEERENLFKWVGPISSTKIALIAIKYKKIKINSEKDIMKYKVGAVKDDIGEQLLIKAGIDKKKIDALTGIDAINLSIRKLKRNRIEVWAYEENVAKWEIKKKGYNPDEYETVYILKEGELYYAFHINTSDSLVQKFQSALDELKKDGAYQKIVNKYLK